MAESFVQLPANSVGTKVRTEELTVGANVVDQEVVTLGDPSASGNLANITAAGALKVDASAVTQPVSFSGNVTVVQPTGSSLHTNVDNFPATQPVSGAVAVSNFPATQPVSGTVSVTNFTNPLPVSQSGTWTVQPGNTPNTTPWLATVNQGGNSAAVTASNALKVDGSTVTQPISGTVVVGNLPVLGPQQSSNSLPVVLAGDQTLDSRIRDSIGEDLYGTNNALNVHLAGTEILNLDGTGNLGVNVQGVVPISATAALPVSATALPLPANSAQETGGNLASVMVNTQFSTQVPDLLRQILAQLQLLNLNFAASCNISTDDLDASSLVQ
jgi:hypothetical protein